jgi:DNA polymerase V
LRQFNPRLEIYSIDECFLDLTGIKRDLVGYGQEIKETVTCWTGLPICVGIAHSKTLAKLANHYAKEQPELNGICDFTSMRENELDAILKKLRVSSVWGIGRRLENSLKTLGVENVLRLKRANLGRVRDRFGIVMQRTVQELNGEPWLELDEATSMAKQVMSSRSFGQRVESLQELREAISYHAPMQPSGCEKRACLPTLCRYSFRTVPSIRPNSMAEPRPLPCLRQRSAACRSQMRRSGC